MSGQVFRQGVVVTCGDAAHRSAIDAILRAHGLNLDAMDLVALPGGLFFVQVRDEFELVKELVEIYRAIHQVKNVYLVLPTHCGAYGRQPHVTEIQREHAAAFAYVCKEMFTVQILEPTEVQVAGPAAFAIYPGERWEEPSGEASREWAGASHYVQSDPTEPWEEPRCM